MAWLSDSLVPWLAWRLVAASAQGALAIALVWFLSRRVASPAARVWLWWFATLAVVVSLLPLPSLEVPVLPDARSGAQRQWSASPPSNRVAQSIPQYAAARHGLESRPAREWPRLRLLSLAVVGMWCAAVLLQGWRLVAGHRRMQSLVKGSTALDRAETNADRLAALVGLSVAPPVCVSCDIDAPLVVGIRHPIVLIPPFMMTTLSCAERDMALCHEFAHVRRRDLAFGWIPAIAERVFVCHPLVRLAAREYATEREAACDALVLEVMGVRAHDYGQMLVRLGVANARPALTAGGSSPSLSSLKRRLIMLKNEHGDRVPRGTIAWVVTGVVLVMIPFQLVAGPIDLQLVPSVSVARAASDRPATTDAQATQTQPATQPSTQPPRQGPRAGAQKRQQDERPQIVEAIATHRAEMARIQQALRALQVETEALYVREQQMQQQPQRAPQAERFPNEAQLRAEYEAELRRFSEVRGVEQQSTQQYFATRLQELGAQQESLASTLKQLQEQIEAIRNEIQKAR